MFRLKQTELKIKNTKIFGRCKELLGIAVEIGKSKIIAAIVSAVMAIAILTVKESTIEPHRWRKNIRVSNLEERL